MAIVGGVRCAKGSYAEEESQGGRCPRPCGGQTRVREVHQTCIESNGYEVAVATNTPRIVEDMPRATRGARLHEALEEGAREQRRQDMS